MNYAVPAGDTDNRPDICRQYVGGKWGYAQYDATHPVTNSSTGDIVAQTPLSGSSDVNMAVRAAAGAFPEWSSMCLTQRVKVLSLYRQLLAENADEIALTICIENGKTRQEAHAEIDRGMAVVDLACGAAMFIKGETLDNVQGMDYQTERCPLGVCVGIGAFNFPFMTAHWMFPVALACGNTFVFKPSHQTPLTTLKCVSLLEQAGLPEGVFNVVHGAKDAVEAMISHGLVRAVSFVGSTPVAQYVYRTAAAHGKRVQAEGGAKNHLVVMPDAPLDRAVPEIISAAYGNSGARCMATSVVIAVDGVGDRLVPMLRDAASKIRVGRTDNCTVTEMGPLVSKEHRKRVAAYIEGAEADGAALVLDGRSAQVPGAPYGNYIGPTLFDHVKRDQTIAKEEVFGPVLCVMRMNSLQEAIAHINGIPFGNAVAIYTRDAAAARKMRREIAVGMVGINVATPAPPAAFCFTGWKSSFLGDLHVQGTESFAFYTQEKVVTTRWL